MEKLVLVPLSALQGMFTAPQKLIQKRYDKLLDYCCRLERSSSSSTAASSMSPGPEDPSDPARRDYEALNALLVEELQHFNLAAYTILNNSVVCLVALLKELMGNALVDAPSLQQLPVRISRTRKNTAFKSYFDSRIEMNDVMHLFSLRCPTWWTFRTASWIS